MSATNRGSKRINTLLLEPCVGDGIIIKTMKSIYMNKFGHVTNPVYRWLSYDIRSDTYRPESDIINNHHFVQDFLTLERLPKELLTPDMNHYPISAVITNPPFSLLNQFLYHSRKLCPEADLVFLLRLNTLAGGDKSGRPELYKRLGTPDVYVVPNRPSFTKGKTDACEYGWFVFPPTPRNYGIVRILDQTPSKERK
jgi:hypothetical protein